MVERLEGEADYQSLQQFLADSPWDHRHVIQAVVERVAPVVNAEAWVLDDTGFPKDGKHSPGVKRQYSGTLGKIGNCQIGVSLHAVSEHATLPLGWALYLPEDWCDDPVRRRKAKIPEHVGFQTKPELGVELIERARAFGIDRAPVLGDAAYGDSTRLRSALHAQGIEYVLSIKAETTIFQAGTVFAVPDRAPGSKGPAPSALRAEDEAICCSRGISTDHRSEEALTCQECRPTRPKSVSASRSTSPGCRRPTSLCLRARLQRASSPTSLPTDVS